MPAVFSSFANSFACSEYTAPPSMVTLLTAYPSPTSGPKIGLMRGDGCPHGRAVQPAFFSIPCKTYWNVVISESLELIATSYGVPAKRCSLSAIWEEFSFDMDRAALKLTNSRADSWAFWFASAALASASDALSIAWATFSSDPRWRVSAFDLAFRANRISAATPRAISVSANTGPHVSIADCPWRNAEVKTTSTTSPKTTAAPPHSAKLSFLETASRNSSSSPRSLGLLIFPLLPKSGRGNGARPNLAFVILVALIFCLFMLAWFA
jgi:hypothetical protein